MRIPDPIANTTTEAYLAYKAGVLAEGDLKPKLYDPYIHLDAWLAYWAGLTKDYPVKNVGKNLFNIGISLSDWFQTFHDGLEINAYTVNRTTATIENNKLVIDSYDNTGWTWLSRWVSLEKNTEYVISGKNTQAIRVVGFNSKEQSARGTLIRVKPSVQSVSYVTFNTGDYNYYALSFYPSGANEYFEDVQIEKGSSRTAYEPYTGEPEMLTDEEALIAYLSGVTNTYPEEFRDPADVRVAAYLKYLVSARWGRPEYPVTNEELYLSMMDAPYIPAGEPSSDIEIDDTAEAPFKDVKMYGDTSQTTYTGKNLWPINSSIPTYNCTITPGDNSLAIVATGSNSNIYPHFYLEANTQYTFSGEFKITNYVGASSIGAIIQGYDGNAWVVIEDGRSEVSDTNTHTFSVSFSSASYSMVRVGFGTNVWNTSFANTVVLSNPQLEKSATATSFEPYVGGVPAPNPDYPQAVNTVTGRQVVKVEGKNLWYVPASETQSGGVSFLNNGDGTFDVTGTNNLGHEQLWKYFATPEEACIKDGETYTLSVLNAPADLRVRVEVYKGATWVKGFISRGSTATLDMSGGDNLRFSVGVTNGTTMNAKNVSVQLEKGSTATDFIPYQSGEYEINLGKNLYSGGISETGKRLSTSTGGSYTDANYDISSYIPVSPNTVYTINTQGRIFCDEYTSDKTFVIGHAQTYGVTDPITITTSSTTRFIRFDFPKGNDAVSQFEVGSEATSYAPYFEPIELCKIGTYQDSIYENDGKWYVRKETGKYTFDDTSIFTWGGDRNRFYIGETALNNLGVDYVWPTWTGTDLLAFSDKFKATNFSYGYNNATTGALCMVSNTGTLSFRNVGVWTNGDVAKLELAGTTFYYVHTTPTDTEITNTALIDQLNALKNGGSYTGTTYIKVSATDPNLPGLLKVEAYKYD